MSDKKPVIFISYSHKDRRWLDFVQGHLEVAVTNDHFETWDDRRIEGGANWAREIDAALEKCAAFILLISRHSLVSSFILKQEVHVALEAHWARGVKIYPIIVQACDVSAVPWLTKMNIRPRDMKALALYSPAKRDDVMASLAAEIRDIVKNSSKKTAKLARSKLLVDYGRLPETFYKRLVGREAELQLLDEAWANANTNIFSLVAEGGAGKSALVNEWLKRLQVDKYRGAEAVLGWSFYSQGTKERATSAEQFLNEALDKLGVKTETISSTARGEAIAEAMTERRVLLVLDGVEPLQYGPGPQLGQLKDQGLRALLRRFAASPPGEAHGLIVLTSRLGVKDIGRWEDSFAPLKRVDKLSDEAGMALLRDNGVRGTNKELEAAAHDFGGHPLALDLLASFLKETQTGDVHRRDRIRGYFGDRENPRHDHAKRVMESYEKEWLASYPVQYAIMKIVGLFDRPASDDCLAALRAKPVIRDVTDQIVELDESEWQRAVARLREVRLLAPSDPAAPHALDAHPLVREWFGERLRVKNEKAWQLAHGRLYEHLRDTTKEGKTPTLEDLAPLYQAIAHGCRARRHQEALNEIYANRICRRLAGDKFEFYATMQLGAGGTDLAAISWFFDIPYEMPVTNVTDADQAWVLSVAAFSLRTQGRFAEALPAMRAALRMNEQANYWSNAGICASNLSESELLVGEIDAAMSTAELAVVYADRSGDKFQMMSRRLMHAHTLHALGRNEEAHRLFIDAEQRQKNSQPKYPLLYSLGGYYYCEFLLINSHYSATRDRARRTLEWTRSQNWVIETALHSLSLSLAHLGLALSNIRPGQQALDVRDEAHAARVGLAAAIEGLRAAGMSDRMPLGFLARAAFSRSVGDWESAARDLDEVEEIAEPGPMRLFLCDRALECARLAFAKIEGFAPLNGLIDDCPPRPVELVIFEAAPLEKEARKQLAIAADYIKTCGYHLRDGELAELEAVLRGERRFAELPPRV